MKKAFFTILFGLMTFAFSACGNSNQGLASTTESLSAGTEQISSADQNSFAEQSKRLPHRRRAKSRKTPCGESRYSSVKMPLSMN